MGFLNSFSGVILIRYGSYRVFQRYQCENCDRTFNDQTATAFEHSAVALKKWFLAVYAYIRFNTVPFRIDKATA
jgi:transposase-like protein